MPLNLLIVDDSIVMRKILGRSLRLTQIPIGTVVEASDGREALERLGAGHSIHVILTDVDMPNMNGIQLLREVKQDDNLKRLPVVIVTTDGAEAVVMEALNLGAAGYIRKPFTPLQLQELLNRLVTV